MRNDFNEKKVETLLLRTEEGSSNRIWPVKGKEEEERKKKKKGIQMRKHYNNNKSEMP